MNTFDFELLASEVLRALRGQRSQVQLSRRLGYKSNVVYLWESGRNYPTASTTMRAASRVGIDVTGAVKRFYRQAPSWLADIESDSCEGIARVLDDLRGDTSIQEIAARTGRSRFAVARWLKGTTEPRLPDFLRLLEATSQRLLDFLAELVDVASLPSAASAWMAMGAARRLLAKVPWSPAVLLALETVDYRRLKQHEVGWIARRLGLPLEAELECIELLALTGQISMVKRRWQVAQIQAVDTRSDPDAGRRLKEWWGQVGLDYMREQREGLFSFNIFSVSEKDLARLAEMHRNYYRALRAVVATSDPPERVVVANLQLFALDAAPS